MKRRSDDTFGRNVLDIYAFARGEPEEDQTGVHVFGCGEGGHAGGMSS